MDFQIEANKDFEKGESQANPVLLEPIRSLRILAPEHFLGAINSDLTSKRAGVLGMSQEGGNAAIEAQAPLAELLRSAIDLRSITQGRGTFAMQYNHHEEVPQHIAQRI